MKATRAVHPIVGCKQAAKPKARRSEEQKGFVWLAVFFGRQVLPPWFVALTRFECLALNQVFDRVLYDRPMAKFWCTPARENEFFVFG